MSYAHPVFISYKHSPTLDYWLPTYFEPLFQEYLDNFLASHRYKGLIFRDSKLEAGDRWRQKIATLLKSSCTLLTFWSPQYFESPYCWAEWLTFRQREIELKMSDSGLVVPVLACEGDAFPQDAELTQAVDLSKFVTKCRGFENMPQFMDFESAVKDLARNVAQRVKASPEFRPDWPVVDFADKSVLEKTSSQAVPFPSLAA